MESLKDKTIKGIIWSGIERFSVQIIQWSVLIVMARILTPEDYGLVGMLVIFISVASSLTDSGFTQALIRKQNRTDTDCCSALYFNIVVSVLMYAILFTISPLVARFYNEPRLVGLMRVLCIVVIINSFGIVQHALFSAKIDFRTLAKVSVTTAFLSGLCGVSLAYSGNGVWALVWQQIIGASTGCILIWIISSWRPKMLFSWQSLSEMFSFGGKLMISGLIDTIYSNLYSMIIGKTFSARSLGFYTQARNFTKLPSAGFTGVLQRVTYPVLSTIQDDDDRLRSDYRLLLRLSAFIIFPILCLIGGLSEPLVNLVLGRQWTFAAVLIVPLCLSGMWYPIHAINLNLLQVKGRSDLFLRLEVIKKMVGVTVIFVSIPYGLIVMCWCTIVSSLFCLIINTHYTGKLIQVGILLQFRDLSSTLFASLAVMGIAYGATLLFCSTWLQVIIGGVAGIISYIFIASILCSKESNYLWNIVKPYLYRQYEMRQ